MQLITTVLTLVNFVFPKRTLLLDKIIVQVQSNAVEVHIIFTRV